MFTRSPVFKSTSRDASHLHGQVLLITLEVDTLEIHLSGHYTIINVKNKLVCSLSNVNRPFAFLSIFKERFTSSKEKRTSYIIRHYKTEDMIRLTLFWFNDMIKEIQNIVQYNS